MSWPPSLTTVTVHGAIEGPDGTAAAGTVEFRCPYALRVNADDVIVAPFSVVGTLVDGEFSVVLPVNDDADVSPSGWTYAVAVRTDVWRTDFAIEVPTAGGDPRELRDIAPVVTPPEVVSFALSAHSHSGADITSGTVAFARLPVGETSTTVAQGDHAHAGGGGSAVSFVAERHTEGDISTGTGSVWAVQADTDISIPAAVGDLIELTYTLMRSDHTGLFLDWVVVTSAGTVIARAMSSDTNTPLSEGLTGLYPESDAYRGAPGPWTFVVASGDLEGGAVRIQLAMKRATTGTVYRNATYPILLGLKNFGAAG